MNCRDALAMALPLLRETRDSILECETFPIGDRSTLDEEMRPLVVEYDEAIVAAELALLAAALPKVKCQFDIKVISIRRTSK